MNIRTDDEQLNRFQIRVGSDSIEKHYSTNKESWNDVKMFEQNRLCHVYNGNGFFPVTGKGKSKKMAPIKTVKCQVCKP